MVLQNHLALELARTNVTVNAICPGFIGTEMVAAMPEKVLEKIVAKVPTKTFRTTRRNCKRCGIPMSRWCYITGQQLNINGGFYM